MTTRPEPHGPSAAVSNGCLCRAGASRRSTCTSTLAQRLSRCLVLLSAGARRQRCPAWPELSLLNLKTCRFKEAAPLAASFISGSRSGTQAVFEIASPKWHFRTMANQGSLVTTGVRCHSCNGQIPVNPAGAAAEFSVPCPHCGRRDFYEIKEIHTLRISEKE